MIPRLNVLVTGFVPFGDDHYNPSGVTARWLHGKHIHTGRGDTAVVGRVMGKGDIPVRFVNEGNGGAKVVEDLIMKARPNIVISLGQANAIFEVERHAGDQKKDRTIRTDSPGYKDSYSTTLPVDAVVKAIASAGGTVQADDDAGDYVCEDVFYHVMRIAKNRPGDLRILRAGFIHVPRSVLLEDGSCPNEIPPGVTPVSQTLINNAIYRAVEATLADVTKEELVNIHK